MDFFNRILDKFPNASIFCFCCSIEKGTVFIGWLNLIGYLIAVISDIGYIVSGIGGGLSLGTVVVFMITDVAFVLLSYVLILGVKNGNSRYVHLWLCVSLIMILLYVILLIVSIVSALIAWIASSVIGIIWKLYCIMIVNVYYRKMDGGPVTY